MTTAANTPVPAVDLPDPVPGYVYNARGQQVRASVMSELDKMVDVFVHAACAEARAEQARIRELRNWVTTEADTLGEMALEEHGIKLGGAKGNKTLRTFDGRFKIEFVKQEFEVADDLQIAAAQELINRFLSDGTNGLSNDHVIALNWAFKRGSDGRWDIRRLKDVTKLPIKHPDWGQAMDIIIGAIRVGGVREYVRFFERVPGTFDKYEPISLDIAKLI